MLSKIAELKSIPVRDDISNSIGKYAIDDENHIKQIEAGTEVNTKKIFAFKKRKMSLNAKVDYLPGESKDSITFIITNKHGTKLGHVVAGLDSKDHIVEIETIYDLENHKK